MSLKFKVGSLKLGCLMAILVLNFSLFTLNSGSAHAETVKTASQPWVTNYVAQAVAPLASTNQVAQAVAPKADATKVIAALGQTTTNTVVYSSTPLLIRAHTDPDGVKRYRLIDLEP